MGAGYTASSGTDTRGVHTDVPGSGTLSLHRDTVRRRDPPASDVLNTNMARNRLHPFCFDESSSNPGKRL